jgi:hypothetical protein
MSVFLWWLGLVARIGQHLTGGGVGEEYLPDDPLIVYECRPRAASSSDDRCAT